MSFGVTYQVKNLFFDRALVKREVGKQNAAALARIGAFVRRRARSSMRRRKAASQPGQPPSAHSRDKVASLKNILFAYDRANQSVVIGPVLLNGRQGSVPSLHEFGGSMFVEEKLEAAPAGSADAVMWVPRGRRPLRPGQATRRRRATYAPRPFMGPALAAEAPNFPSLWVSNAGGRAA